MLAWSRQIRKLCTTCNHFYRILHTELLIYTKIYEIHVLREHTEVIIFVHFRVVVNQIDGKHYNHKEKDDRHDNHMIFFLHEERRKSYSHIEGTCTIRITILHALLLSLFISQTFVGLRNHDELSTSLRVILISIRMVKKGQLSVSLPDLFNRSIILNFQNLIRIEAFHILLWIEDDWCALEDAVSDGRQQQNLDSYHFTFNPNLKVM